MAIKSKLTTEEIIKLYQEGKSIYDIAPLAGISSVAIWKRINKAGFIMSKVPTPWAKEKRGVEFQGADGRYWVRGIRSSKGRNSQRRYIVVMEEYLGHPIPSGMVVHHIDGNPINDDIDNLALVTKSAHNTIHHKKNY